MSATTHTQSCLNHARFLTRSISFLKVALCARVVAIKVDFDSAVSVRQSDAVFPVHCLKWIAIRRSKCLIKTRQTGCLNTLTFFNHK